MSCELEDHNAHLLDLHSTCMIVDVVLYQQPSMLQMHIVFSDDPALGATLAVSDEQGNTIICAPQKCQW